MPVALPEKFAALAPWFDRHRRDAWLPVVEEGDGEGSKFGGAPRLAAGEAWPACGRCNRPMALFLQLDLAAAPDPKLRARLGNGLLQCFFCTDVDCIHGPEEGDPFTPTHLLRVVDPREASVQATAPGGEDPSAEIPTRRIVGWDRVDDYPSMTEAEELGLEHEISDRLVCKNPPVAIPAKLKEVFELPWARDNEKLGGWPGWANISVAYPECPTCGRRMDVTIFQFGHEGHIPIMFGDGGQGHVVCCPDHPHALAYPWTCG